MKSTTPVSEPTAAAREAGSPPATPGAILLFDGVCNLCNGTVRFVLDRDAAGYFRFGALQSDPGRRLLEAHGLPADELSTLVLLEEGRAYQRSEAALRVARRLDRPWPLLWAFRHVPLSVRDRVYDWIAEHRYRWFGTRDACAVPTAETRSRFLT